MSPHTLILVLSALRTPWRSMMDCSRETWDAKEHPGTTTIYYVGRSGEPQLPRTIYSVFDEELHNIGRRTLEAYEDVLSLKDWTHLARPHSSTYVHKRRLVDYVAGLPERDVMAGLMTEGEDPFMWGGGHYVFSRDVIERLVAEKAHWNHEVMEDVAVTRLAQLLGIPFTQGRTASINPCGDGMSGWDMVCYGGKCGGYHFTDFADVNVADDQFFFRCKHDSDRSVDLQTFRLLNKYLLP